MLFLYQDNQSIKRSLQNLRGAYLAKASNSIDTEGCGGFSVFGRKEVRFAEMGQTVTYGNRCAFLLQLAQAWGVNP